MKLSASVLSADFLRLGADIDRAYIAGCEFLHLDVMDGHFVPNLAVGLGVVEALKSDSRMRKDTHLMVSNPESLIDLFAAAGSESIIIHAESTPHHIRLLRDIKKTGKLAGIALTPETPVDAVRCALEEADIVLQVAVCVGFGGQKAIRMTFEKLRLLQELKRKYGYTYEIQVDGGINRLTYKSAMDFGAEVLVCGSLLFGAEDMTKTALELRAGTL